MLSLVYMICRHRENMYYVEGWHSITTITELPNNELTGIHTLSLPPLLL